MKTLILTRCSDGTITKNAQTKLAVIIVALALGAAALLSMTLDRSVPTKIIHPKIAIIKPKYGKHLAENRTIRLEGYQSSYTNTVQAIHFIDDSEGVVSLENAQPDRDVNRLIFDTMKVLDIIRL